MAVSHPRPASPITPDRPTRFSAATIGRETLGVDTRFNIGFSLSSLFYSSRYWINDPGYYRLPPAYGGTRWIRYYNDALLVDTYSGEVIDVINDFFW